MPPNGDVVEIVEKVHAECIQKSLCEKYGGVDTYETCLDGDGRLSRIEYTPILVFGVGVNEVPMVAAVEIKFAQAKLTSEEKSSPARGKSMECTDLIPVVMATWPNKLNQPRAEVSEQGGESARTTFL
jgi:hypothetical protein